MQNFSISPLEIFASLWRNQNLIRAMIKREVIGRYRGSFLGIIWSFFNPVLMLAVYTFVFSVVFKARWNSGSDSKTEFALVLFSGLIVFNIFSECVNRAPTLILANVNYVKKVVFPLEIFPWISMGAALFHGFISLCVWIIFYIIFNGLPHPTTLFLPFVVAPIIIFTMGLSWILASLGVYLRDIAQVVGVATTILMFLTPIFYPASALPQIYQFLIKFNPLAPAIEDTRRILIMGALPDMTTLVLWYAGAFTVFWFGFAWFQKTRKGFSDVI